MELPPIDDRDYQAIFEEARARIAVHNPDWTNHSEADPGITILQLFAFMTDSLLYRANRIPERNRQKFLRLMGLRQRAAVPAEGIVTLDATKGPVRSHLVPADTELRAGSVVFRTGRSIDVLPVAVVACAKVPATTDIDEDQRRAYLSMYQDLDPQAGDVVLYETRRLEVPAGAIRYRPLQLAATVDQSVWVAVLAPRPELVQDVRDRIGGRTLSLGVMPDVVDGHRVLAPSSVQRYEHHARLVVSVPVGGPLPAEPEPRIARYREVDTVEHGDVLVGPGVIDVTLPPPAELELWDDLEPVEEGFGNFPPLLDPAERDRVVTWLRLRRPARSDDASALGASFAWVGANAVEVAQLARVVSERLPDGNGQPDQVVRLGNPSVLVDTVRLVVDGSEWQRVDDLRLAAPEVSVGAQVPVGPALTGTNPYVFTCEPDGTCRFGTGLRGARPPRGAQVRASYAFGGGRDGVVAAGAITAGVGLPPGLAVTNPIPTWGGADTEPMVDAEGRMAELIHHRDRLVTATDFAEITRRTPGVDLARVEILPLFHPDLPDAEAPGVVTVMVIPSFDPAQPDAPRPDQMFLDTVCEHLDPRRLVTTEVHVRGPRYVDVVVSVGFDPAPGRSVQELRERIRAEVRSFLSPIPTPGRPGGGGWPLGKAVDHLEIMTVVARLAGVGRVTGVKVATADGATTGTVPMSGLELPRLGGPFVQPGDAPALDAAVTGGAPDGPTPPRLLPVPTVPEDC